MPKMDLSNIGYFIEVSQVGQMLNGDVWLHSDPVSTGENAHVKREVLFKPDFCINGFEFKVARFGILSQDLGNFWGIWEFSWDLIFPKNSL